MSLVKTQTTEFHPQTQIQQIWGGLREFVSLTRSQLMLLAQEPQFENHWPMYTT